MFGQMLYLLVVDRWKMFCKVVSIICFPSEPTWRPSRGRKKYVFWLLLVCRNLVPTKNNMLTKIDPYFKDNQKRTFSKNEVLKRPRRFLDNRTQKVGHRVLFLSESDRHIQKSSESIICFKNEILKRLRPFLDTRMQILRTSCSNALMFDVFWKTVSQKNIIQDESCQLEIARIKNISGMVRSVSSSVSSDNVGRNELDR